MDLKEQEYVVALAEYGSITRAAEALFISQPTLSIFLSRLENRLGTPLFDKIGRKLVPTVAGELYVRRAKELLRQDLSPITDVRASAQYRLLCAAELLEQAITGWEESF